MDESEATREGRLSPAQFVDFFVELLSEPVRPNVGAAKGEVLKLDETLAPHKSDVCRRNREAVSSASDDPGAQQGRWKLTLLCRCSGV